MVIPTTTAGAATAVAPALLLDAFDFAIVLAVVGLGVYAAARRMSPLRRWGSHGNVGTGLVGPADLALVAAFTAFYYYNVAVTPAALAEAGAEARGGSGSTGDQHALLVAAGTLAMQVLFTAVVAAYLTGLRGWNLSEAFGLRRMRWSQVALWSFAGTLLLAMPLVIGAGLTSMRWLEAVGLSVELQEPVKLLAGDAGTLAKSLLVLSAVVGAPVMEEVLFRGFFYPVFKRFSDRFFAAVVSALFFALAHGSLGALLPLVALGILFAAAYELSGTLLVPAGMHAIFNATQLSQLFGAGLPDQAGAEATAVAAPALADLAACAPLLAFP